MHRKVDYTHKRRKERYVLMCVRPDMRGSHLCLDCYAY